MSQNDHLRQADQPIGLSGLPFDDIKAVLTHFPEREPGAEAVVAARLAARAAAAPRLGRLEPLAAWLAGWQATAEPRAERVQLALFASLMAPFGSAAEIASAQETLELAAAGGHAASALCLRHGVGLKVYDLAVDMPTADIRHGASLSEEDCAATMAFGMEAIAGGVDILALSRTGAGAEAAAATLVALLFSDLRLDLLEALPEPLAEVAAAAIAAHSDHARDPFELLRRVGTRDMAASVGAILAARTQRIPVLLDGFVTLAAAAVLHRTAPGNLDHCLAAAAGGPLERLLAPALGLEPLIDCGTASGEGVGALLALPLLRSAADVVASAVSRAEAGLQPA